MKINQTKKEQFIKKLMDKGKTRYYAEQQFKRMYKGKNAKRLNKKNW